MGAPSASDSADRAAAKGASTALKAEDKKFIGVICAGGDRFKKAGVYRVEDNIVGVSLMMRHRQPLMAALSLDCARLLLNAGRARVFNFSADVMSVLIACFLTGT